MCGSLLGCDIICHGVRELDSNEKCSGSDENLLGRITLHDN